MPIILPSIDLSPIPSNNDLVIVRGDSFTYSFPCLDTPTELWFTCKRCSNHSDSQAIIQITGDDGLIRLVGGPVTTPDIASIAHQTGSIRLTLDAALTAQLPATPYVTYAWDIQIKLANDSIRTPHFGTIAITPDITRAT